MYGEDFRGVVLVCTAPEGKYNQTDHLFAVQVALGSLVGMKGYATLVVFCSEVGVLIGRGWFWADVYLESKYT